LCGAVRELSVTFKGSGIEAAVTAVAALRSDPWLERVGPSTVLDVEVREPATKHAISLQQVERWLDGAIASPNEASRKARLKMMLVKAG
jgi:hypothetical protein